jgi:hypothetical protein
MLMVMDSGPRRHRGSAGMTSRNLRGLVSHERSEETNAR